jgi:putative DNA methylase
MIPKECKRLAEVDFPIAVVSAHAAREKSIRHGHPSTLHLWWARRPLASCRAILLALLLPDPGDQHCPAEFKTKARAILKEIMGVKEGDEGLRSGLLSFIGDVANWDVANHPRWIRLARDLVKAAHPEETPLVVDPFAGGGSIPLEALRLGCDAFASDLNPVACLINKVLLEDIPRYGPELADELRRVGKKVKEAAEKDLAEFYPLDPDKARPIAYLWARTVRCESPNCGAEIPLVRSFWLCKKANRRRALQPKIVRPKVETPRVEFEIFEPKSEKEVHGGTVNRAKATCLCCNTVLSPDRVRAQLAQQHGGADVIFDSDGLRTAGARMLAVVSVQSGQSGRQYRLPVDRDYLGVWKAQQRLRQMKPEKTKKGLSLIPNEPTPVGGGSGAGRAFSYRQYGMLTFRDLFNNRQAATLATLAQSISDISDFNGPMCLALGKLVDLANAVCRWEPVAECPRNVFAAGRVKAAWEFAEGVPTSDSSGSFSVCIENLCQGIQSVLQVQNAASVSQEESQSSPLPDTSTAIWFTDPPYYDAYPYADLADAFLVWLGRAGTHNSTTRITDPDTPSLSPKNREIVQDESRKCNARVKDSKFFEDEMALAFREGRRVLQSNGVGCVVFAHKTTEGWEALLSGMITGGLTITGSWPIATELAHRLRAKDSAALATSVHLICRPRPEDAPTGDWGEVLRELPGRVYDWMDRLQDEGVRGADLVFACIGPALEIFSRYAKVETAEGDKVTLDVYLQKVWEVVGRTALEKVLGTAESKARNGAAGALEEDARLTALFLWTIQATAIEAANGSDTDDEEADEDDDEETAAPTGKGFSLVFDVARRFAQPLGIHLDAWEGRIVETKKGIVRLLPVSERADQLFGEEGAQAVADRLEAPASKSGNVQLSLFPDEPPPVKPRKGGRKRAGAEVSDDKLSARREATTLDRVHAAMLLQASGRTNALRALLTAEQERGPDFLRLANALSALYPSGCEEKRLLDAMLLAVRK